MPDFKVKVSKSVTIYCQESKIRGVGQWQRSSWLHWSVNSRKYQGDFKCEVVGIMVSTTKSAVGLGNIFCPTPKSLSKSETMAHRVLPQVKQFSYLESR